MRVPVTDATKAFSDLLLSLPKQLGWGNTESLLLPLHTSSQTSPTQRLFYQRDPVVLKESSVRKSFVGWGFGDGPLNSSLGPGLE